MSKQHIKVATIDTAVPIPEAVSYPFDSLKVGDSFIVEEKRRSSVASRAAKVSKEQGKQFTVRKTKPGEVRVWRTK